MNIVKNPARSRPLSANVRRLMKMARESPLNPDVKKVIRVFTDRDRAYCDMQGHIFMAAIDKRVSMQDFAPLYMTSQLAGVMDHSFSRTGNIEEDSLSRLLQIPMLLKSPETIVDCVIWLNNIVCNKEADQSANLAVVSALQQKVESPAPTDIQKPDLAISDDDIDIDRLTADYEYAYWLGYIYRYECLLHDESSRMVYGAFNEEFMRETYGQMFSDGAGESISLSECAGEMCKRLDSLLVGKLWK